jgi:hypothetical protein
MMVDWCKGPWLKESSNVIGFSASHFANLSSTAGALFPYGERLRDTAPEKGTMIPAPTEFGIATVAIESRVNGINHQQEYSTKR